MLSKNWLIAKEMKNIKTMMMSATILLGMGMMTMAQTAAAAPTLKQTMDWLTDYVVRETGCEDGVYIIKSSYDLQHRQVYFTEDNKHKISIPLYNIKQIETKSYGEDPSCWKVKVTNSDSSIKYVDEFRSSILIMGFRTKEAANRVTKALRHAAKLTPKPKELF